MARVAGEGQQTVSGLQASVLSGPVVIAERRLVARAVCLASVFEE